MQMVKNKFSKIYPLTTCVVLLVTSAGVFATGPGEEKGEEGREVQGTVTLRQVLRKVKDEYGINCLNQPLKDSGEATMSALLALLNLPSPEGGQGVSWTEEEIGFCRRCYQKEPSKPKRFYEIPILEVEASELASYVPFANVIWGLKIKDADDTTLELLEKFPKLMSLDLYYCTKVGEAGIQSLSTHCRFLKELKLGGCSQLTDTHIDSIVRGCPQLTRLDLTLCYQLTDASFESIAKYCPNLTRLQLFIWSRVNNPGLLHLNNLPTLRVLRMRNGEVLERKGIRRLLRSLTESD